MNSITIVPKTLTTLKIGVVANLLEWYEFSIYGYLAVIIGLQYFNTNHDIVAVILAFSIFSVSYIIRPIGGLFFGYVADKYGLTRSLKISLLMMSVPTCLIGILPVYDDIGAIAPAALIVLRLIQGFGAGGELPASACYVYETSTKQNRGFLCSSVSASSLAGVLLGSLIVTVLSLYLEKDAMLTWGWRVPFLLGIPLTILIFRLRRSIQVDIPLQERENTSTKHSEFTINGLLNNTTAIMQASILIAFLQVSFYILFVWMPTYLEYFLDVPTNLSRLTNTLTLVAMTLITLFFGYISRYFKRKQIILTSIGISILLSYPLFMLLPTGSFLTLLIVQFIFALAIGAMNGVMMETLAELFPKHIRCSGFSLTFSTATSLFGGSAPAICSYLVYKTGIISSPAIYIICFGLLALPFAFSLKVAQ